MDMDMDMDMDMVVVAYLFTYFLRTYLLTYYAHGGRRPRAPHDDHPQVLTTRSYLLSTGGH